MDYDVKHSDDLQAALRRLVADGTLTAAQAHAVRHALDSPTPSPTPARGDRPARGGMPAVLAEVGGYIGSAFVLGAMVIIAGPNWHHLSHLARIATLAVPGVIVLLAALAVGRMTPRVASSGRSRERLISALVLGGAALGAGAAAVIADGPHGNGGGAWDGVAAWLSALVIAGGAYFLIHTPLLHLGTAISAAGATITLATSPIVPWTWPAYGVLITCLGVVWGVLVARGYLDERQLGLGVAGALIFFGGETMAQQGGNAWLGYLVLGALAVAGLVGYTRSQQVVVLVVGVLALATVVPQAVLNYTHGALSGAAGLLVLGLSIVGASVLGFRLHREIPAR